MSHRPRIIPMPIVFIECSNSICPKQPPQRHIVAHCTTFKRAKQTSRLTLKPLRRPHSHRQTIWPPVIRTVAQWRPVSRVFDIAKDQWMLRTKRVCFTVCTDKPVHTSPCPANWLQPTCAWAHYICTNCIIVRIIDDVAYDRHRVNSTFGKRHISNRIPMPVHRVWQSYRRRKPQRRNNHHRQYLDKMRPPRKRRCFIQRKHNTRLSGCSKVWSIEYRSHFYFVTFFVLRLHFFILTFIAELLSLEMHYSEIRATQFSTLQFIIAAMQPVVRSKIASHRFRNNAILGSIVHLKLCVDILLIQT